MPLFIKTHTQVYYWSILRTSINLACNNLNTFITDTLNICNCIKLFIFTLSVLIDWWVRWWKAILTFIVRVIKELICVSWNYMICMCAFYIFTDVWCPFLVDSVLCVCVCACVLISRLVTFHFIVFTFLFQFFTRRQFFVTLLFFSHIIYYPL